METVKECDARVDEKNRVTLRGARYKFYNIKEYTNWCYLLEPRELKSPEGISRQTLRDMDEAIANLRSGEASDAIDLSDFQVILVKFEIRVGIPRMASFWNGLQTRNRNGTATMDDIRLYKKLGKALKLLADDPRHPSLHTHDIDSLTKRYGTKV